MLVHQLIVLDVSRVLFDFQGVYLELTSLLEKISSVRHTGRFFGQVILLLFHCNYVCPFCIYVYMFSEVRKAFKRLILKYLRRNNTAPISGTTHNSVTRRISYLSYEQLFADNIYIF
jgi:hypothetical protein